MYNEEKRLDEKAFQLAFDLYNHIDFLLIDDASIDQTPDIIYQLTKPQPNVYSIKNDVNLGKGASIRNGVIHTDLSKYKHIGYLDADLSVPFFEMKALLDIAIQKIDKPFVMGSRIKLISNHIIRSKGRHYFGRIFATVISQFILKTPVYDTQCGAKIIQAELANQLFIEPFETRWLFDIELLLRYKKQNSNFIKNVLEIPLNIWEEKGKTKIKFYEFILFPLQIVKLYFKYA